MDRARFDSANISKKILCHFRRLREKSVVETRFLLGPAGSGKTWRCLAEIRAELRRDPDGLPLLLLAPKQATFQLERQLLSDASLAGYSRLQILSFDRLADFVVTELLPAPPRLLDDEGRVMALHALLAQMEDRLKLFHATARLPGFARQLSLVLREFQRHQLSPERLRQLAKDIATDQPLSVKLHDLALMLDTYLDWLAQRGLKDADSLPDLAAPALRDTARATRPLRLGGLWLDGFAEMTAQEIGLLAALAPLCERVTLAFCLEAQPTQNPTWLSMWSVVAQTFRRSHHHLAALPDREVVVEVLERSQGNGRFAANPALQHLEANWAQPKPFIDPARASPTGADSVRLVACANPEAEAVFVAREILRHVRAGGRYRECAVLLRQLDGHHDALRRVFSRYEIPFFLDRRQPVTHHPLAELTRFALRTAAFGWRIEDWFGALKSGLVPVDDELVDELENDALENGWEGDAWHRPLAWRKDGTPANGPERLRERLVPPFARLAAATARPLSGQQLADALRGLWAELDVATRLDEWSATPAGSAAGRVPGTVHLTVWQQMQEWLENLDRAFPDGTEPLPLREWLPILEAGLGGLSVGVIPPALDQVLIGAVDRSRNPELELALVAGLNEGAFPAAPSPGFLLTDAERSVLEREDVHLGPTTRQQLGHERYLGYIACTRARGRLILTRAERDADGKPLNPSPFFAHVRRLFAELKEENFNGFKPWSEGLHASEVLAPLSASAEIALSSLEPVPALRDAVQALRQQPRYGQPQSLAPAIAEQLHGPADLFTSVSRIEQFAACPFRFFVNSGLAAEERKRFEMDARERGSFQHDVLARFHEELRAENKRWRDLAPGEASERIARIAAAVGDDFRGGLFQASDHSLFTARSLTRSLQSCVETLIAWMHAGYLPDPYAVEFGFGGRDDTAGPWSLDLGAGHRLLFRGKIDRIDLARDAATGASLCVVLDYKSSARKIDRLLLEHGIQIQLPAYLAALRALGAGGKLFGTGRLVPAGVFYVNLRGAYRRGESRDDVLSGAEQVRQAAFQHSGRINFAALPQLDSQYPAGKSGQFKYRVTNTGRPYKGGELLEAEAFAALLDDVERQLITMGRRIFAGDAAVDPYRKGGEIACDQCEYGAVCRIDPWTHRYRVLRETAEAAD